jgi:hypothetical protein
VLEAAGEAARQAGVAPHPAAGAAPGGGQQQQQQQQQDEVVKQQQQKQQEQKEEQGASEARAHAALLAHPVARQLRTVPRAGGGGGGCAGGGKGRVLVGVRFATVHDRQLPPGAEFAPAAAAEADWAAALAGLATEGGAAAGCAPCAHAEGARALTVSACAHELGAVVAWLAAQPQVHWLDPRRAMRLHNRVASAVTQGAVRGAAVDDVATLAAHPFWQPPVGLRGEGQVVGVGDSGLDTDSCYFYDPTVSFTANVQDTPSGKVFASDVHRKVAYYLGRMDREMTDTVGHGTHVCGTIAGLPLNAASDSADAGTGMAPGARLGFIDLSVSGKDEVGVPDDLDKDYFPMAYDRGVRIHSGALRLGGWGVGGGGGAGGLG